MCGYASLNTHSSVRRPHASCCLRQSHWHGTRQQIDVKIKEPAVVELRHVCDLLRRSACRWCLIDLHLALRLAVACIDVEIRALRLCGVGRVREISDRQGIKDIRVRAERVRVSYCI